MGGRYLTSLGFLVSERCSIPGSADRLFSQQHRSLESDVGDKGSKMEWDE